MPRWPRCALHIIPHSTRLIRKSTKGLIRVWLGAFAIPLAQALKHWPWVCTWLSVRSDWARHFILKILKRGRKRSHLSCYTGYTLRGRVSKASYYLLVLINRVETHINQCHLISYYTYIYILLPYASSVRIGFISHFCRPLWQRCGAHLQIWPILLSHQDTFSIFLFLSLQAAPKLATLANQSKLAWPWGHWCAVPVLREALS